MPRKGVKYRLRRSKSRKGPVVLTVAVLLGIVGAWIWVSIPAPSPARRADGGTNVPPPFSPAPDHKPEAPPRTNAPPTLIAKPQGPPSPAPATQQAQPASKPPETKPQAAPSEPPRAAVDLAVFPRPVQSIFEAQVALARQGISSGAVDGLPGPQTRAALTAFQKEQGLKPSGELDTFTKDLLILETEPITSYIVTSNDIPRLQPISATWLGKSQQEALDYENLLELVSEKFRAHPNYIRKLNPGIDWATARAGMLLRVPDTAMPVVRTEASSIRIFLSQRLLEVFDAQSNLVAHFPCSIAQKVEKRPAGELHVVAIAPDPNYTFDPAVFPESAEARELGRKLILPPGPNNPVGIAWISLDKPGYGIHGTPQPEQVGRTESHGCFRLANWNAAHLLQLVKIGMPVYVQN